MYCGAECSWRKTRPPTMKEGRQGILKKDVQDFFGEGAWEEKGGSSGLQGLWPGPCFPPFFD
jgi:hypothetical protein